MAAVIPEVAGGLGGAEAGGAARGGLFRRGGPVVVGGQGGDGSGAGDRGSPAAFVVAILLVTMALVSFWVAFHNPSDWGKYEDEFPGLFRRILHWMTGYVTTTPSLLGPLGGESPKDVLGSSVTNPGVPEQIQQAAENALGDQATGTTQAPGTTTAGGRG